MPRIPTIRTHVGSSLRDPFLGYMDEDLIDVFETSNDQCEQSDLCTIPKEALSCSIPKGLSLQTLYQRQMEFESLVRAHMYHLETGLTAIHTVQLESGPPRKIPKECLQDHCLPLFLQNPQPEPGKLHDVFKAIQQHCPSVHRRDVTSTVRHWFRKKREEVGLKLDGGLHKMYGREEFETMRDPILKTMEDGTFDWNQLFGLSKVELPGSDLAIKFYMEKAINCVIRGKTRA